MIERFTMNTELLAAKDRYRRYLEAIKNDTTFKDSPYKWASDLNADAHTIARDAVERQEVIDASKDRLLNSDELPNPVTAPVVQGELREDAEWLASMADPATYNCTTQVTVQAQMVNRARRVAAALLASDDPVVQPSVCTELAALRSQLPDGMQECTIRFLQCDKGHGRLTATNWVQSECSQCEIERLRSSRAALVERLQELASKINVGADAATVWSFEGLSDMNLQDSRYLTAKKNVDVLIELRSILAEPQAANDDSEPVTESWLESLGWKVRNPTPLTGCTHICPRTNEDIRWGISQGFYVSMFQCRSISTRGDVRLLCKALGVKLEPQAATQQTTASDCMRCVGCGWPIVAADQNGCHEFDCSMRPVPNLEAYKKYLASRSQAAEPKGGQHGPE